MIGRGPPNDSKNARRGDPQPGALYRAIAARPAPDTRSCRERLSYSHLCSAERALIDEGDPLPHESAPLALFALLAFGGLVLLVAPSIVMTGHVRQFDIGLASVMHAWAAGSVWRGQLVPMLAALGSLPPLLALLILGLGYLLWTGRTPTALFVVVAVGGGVAVSMAALWLLASFNGPDAVLPAISAIRTIQAAIVCLASTALVAGEEERRGVRIGLLAVGIATAMAGGAGQVAAGTILPGDALMAWGVAALWSWFCFNLAGIVRECVRLAVTGE